MILDTLRLHSFRAHADSSLTLTPKVNLLVGPNGIGKTNVLEAIHYLCLSKSFLVAQDAYALQKGASFFEIKGSFHGTQRTALTLRLAYVQGEGKRAFVNGAPLERMADLVGIAPIVVFAPEDAILTAGGPEERRRFINNILSQARPVYLDDLMKYRRALRQRNELLQQYRRSRNGAPQPILDSWTTELVTLGARIIHRRLAFVRTFAKFLAEAYAQIHAVAERPTLRYQTVGRLEGEVSLSEIEAIFRTQLDQRSDRERALGRTVQGPHRDELVFKLDDFEVRRYASQGQHRTFGMALKLAQYFYLNDQLEEPPILLLDDVFDNLDPKRSAAFLTLLQTDTIGQCIITAARMGPFEGLLPFDAPAYQVLRFTTLGTAPDACVSSDIPK